MLKQRSMILGFDEVGRGSWAGPLVVGACVLPDGCQIAGLTDSKKLTPKRRLALEPQIKAQALGFGLGWVKASEIDQIGISQALKLASQRALTELDAQLLAQVDQIIVDGISDFVGDPRVSTMKQADLLIPSVSAGAVLAKVARDRYMIELSTDRRYAQYGFEKHVGYGTKAHHQAILEHGVSDQHRCSFRPMSEIVGFVRPAVESSPTTKTIGNWGEQVVVDWLETQGFTILSRNWRTKQFEIDIVAQKDEQICLIEVKTRKNNDFGGGEVAINQFKRQKLQLAAETVLVKYPQSTVIIAAMFVTGEPDNFAVNELIEID